ncbi:hypothetical protein BC937DRAFT_92511 [Endogone sp. FLAS-F59071]|nr:hypothetical protein BC937DRAFT_92511 [Endogone sp. FLAS-F59071]|eukprot:RUS23093.1 hypothetical protein BC937DRAFT_92511 [Endogone sp. FLAS-F59071]
MPDTAPGGNIAIYYIKLFAKKDTTVGELKDLILIKRKHDLQNINSVNITLWKVSIPIDELSKLDLHFKYKINGTELLLFVNIQEAFPNAPAYKYIYIIIELLEVGQQFFGSYYFSRFSTPSPNLKNKYSAILPGHELPTEHAITRLAKKLTCEYHQNIETEGMRFTRISETKLQQRCAPLLKCVLVVNTLRAFEKMSNNEKCKRG